MSSIFLVEDEVLIRMLLADMIQELGHRVAAEAGTIDEGLPLARSAEFDLAILDVNLGKCTAEPIADVIDERGLPIIFASAYDEGGLPSRLLGRTLLQKPFQIWQLAAAIAASCSAIPAAPEASSCSRGNVRRIASHRHR
jgi:DNA-binding response OmpR family regulator